MPELTAPSLFRRLQQIDTRLALAAACVLELIVFAVDLVTPDYVPLGPYYLLPIGLVAWRLSRGVTCGFVIASSLARTYALSGMFPASGEGYVAEDLVVSCFIYALFAFLVMQLARAYQGLATHAQDMELAVSQAAHRRRLNSAIRRAIPTDIDAIIALAAVGAEDGDLSKDVTEEVRQQALRVTWGDSIALGNGARATWAGTMATVPIEFWVCEINGQLAGFFMVTGLNDQTGMERELHAVATSKQYRGLGIGSVLVDFFCDHYYGRKLYAAVMPDSQMYTMLKRRGFYHYASSTTGYIVVERESRPREKGLMPRASSETTDMALSRP